MNNQDLKLTRNVRRRIKQLNVHEDVELIVRGSNLHTGLYAGDKWVCWLNNADAQALVAEGVHYE